MSEARLWHQRREQIDSQSNAKDVMLVLSAQVALVAPRENDMTAPETEIPFHEWPQEHNLGMKAATE